MGRHSSVFPRSATRRWPAALVGAGLAISACGSAGGDTDAVVPTSSTVAASTTTAASAPDALAMVDTVAHDLDFSWLAQEHAATTTTTVPVVVTEPPAAPPTTAAPSTPSRGGAPVTTVGGGGGDDTSIYLGVLGRLGRDEVVTAPVAAAPTVGPGILTLTGLPGNVPQRPAVVVKIDNGSRARPQAGLNAADIVVEEEVEGGVTRFAAIFHSTSNVVGPVRSARTTDIGIINSFGSPLLLYSGANAVTDSLIRAQPTVQNRSAATSSGYWRESSRRAPSNLYSDTGPHWASAAGGVPAPQFAYRAAGEPVPGVDTTSFTVAYRASRAGWTWDGANWLRTQGGRAHLTDGGHQVSAANVVVVEARRVDTGMVDASGASVPEFVWVGSGRATVFTGGKRIDATWTRPTLASVATLTAADGSVVTLTPGRTWVELIGEGSGALR